MLSDYDTASTAGLDSKDDARKILKRDVKRLCKLQDMFAAQTSRAVLIVLQGMDAAGKDGIVKHVMTGLNPQGVNVYGFRAPTTEEVRALISYGEEEIRCCPGTRAHCDLQPVVLRGSARRPGSSGEVPQAQGVADPGPDPWTTRYEEHPTGSNAT